MDNLILHQNVMNIEANLFHNNMADKTVWWITRGSWINEYSLYVYYSNDNINFVDTYA